ncbi:DUF3060 domain-containing protein [Actinophytocola oryzae]|uniref:DUF3060 family protein n=1 Tax=Actinophytocola oryzae TaxID=502181 RepID=A0A4R7VD33_9PSEU|nr:DUF3060 domain-containing protein [Actinophytocola oryzae]TDV47024.1 Protein of unknown function (DUF3060) [Actinophytocola oryzae]
MRLAIPAIAVLLLLSACDTGEDDGAVDLPLGESTGAVEQISTPPSTTSGDLGPGTGTAGLTVTESGLADTLDCGTGNYVVVDGSNNGLTITGTCTTVTVNGHDNTLRLAEASEITVAGVFNTIAWASGNPTVSDTGTQNKVGQG